MATASRARSARCQRGRACPRSSSGYVRSGVESWTRWRCRAVGMFNKDKSERVGTSAREHTNRQQKQRTQARGNPTPPTTYKDPHAIPEAYTLNPPALSCRGSLVMRAHLRAPSLPRTGTTCSQTGCRVLGAAKITSATQCSPASLLHTPETTSRLGPRRVWRLICRQTYTYKIDTAEHSHQRKFSCVSRDADCYRGCSVQARALVTYAPRRRLSRGQTAL